MDNLFLSLKILFAAVVSSWANPSAFAKHTEAVEMLQKLQIFIPIVMNSETHYKINQAFQKHVGSTISSGFVERIEEIPEHVTLKAPTKSQIDAFARERWEQLLLYTVGGCDLSDASAALPSCEPLDLDGLLTSAGLISRDFDGDGGVHCSVTRHGFHFLLLDTYSQLWTILRSYIAQAEADSGTELSSVLGFFLKLGHHREQCLCYNSLQRSEQMYASHLYQLGILLPFSAMKQVWLKPTWLAVLLAGGSTDNMEIAGDGFIVVETNFRVYAYTSSSVRQAILRLFVRCEVLLPNLFVGSMNRDSIMEALESGIKAEQILDYLRQHAHPNVANRKPVVPTVVSDQIRLWERETKRLVAQPAVLYKNFERSGLYFRTRDFAKKLGAMLSDDEAERQMVGKPSSHDSVKMEIKKAKAQLGL